MKKGFGLFALAAILVSPLLGIGPIAVPAAAQTWIELSPVGSPPDPVFVPKPVHYDAVNNRLIAFYPGNPPFNPNPPGNGNEVWVLTNANGLGGTPTWIKLQPTGTPPFSNGMDSVVYDAASNRLIHYGGCFANCSPALANVFVLTNANGLGGTPTWSQSSVTPFAQPRTHHSAGYDVANNRMIAFGGHFAFFGTDQNDARILTNANGLASPSAWSTLAVSGGPPPIRNEHTAVYDEANNRMVVYAGANSQKNFCCGFPFGNMVSDYGDLWVLANANGVGGTQAWLAQTAAGPVPPSRFAHSAVYDSVHNRMIVFGGGHVVNFAAQTFSLLGDLWELSNANGLGGTPTWTQLSQSGTPPGPRGAHTAAFDTANQRMILLGGRNDADVPPVSNRVWVLLLVQMVSIDIEPGSFPNSINLRNRGTIPVAILSSPTFDALTSVNRTSLTFGRTGNEQSLAFCNSSGEDVNGDGLLDLVCHFHTQQTGFQTGDTVGVLKGKTLNNIPIQGSDSVRIVP